MSRLTDSIITAGTGYASASGAPMLNLKYGGQDGWATDYAQLLNSQAYIAQNVICILLAAPTDFTLLDGGDSYIAALKALCELHATSITGLNDGLEVETQESAVGGTEEKLEHPTNVTRARSQVSFRWQEKYGLPIEAFHSMWIRKLIMDPDSKVASINTTSNAPTDRLLDRYSATMAFFEPDPAWKKINRAWIGTNMFPKSTGEQVGVRDKTTGKEELVYDIQYAGVFQTGVAVKALCQSLLEKIVLTNADPYKRATFVTGIDANVAAAGGIISQIQTMGSGAVSL